MSTDPAISKAVISKLRKAEQGVMPRGSGDARLPPGQTATEAWPVLDIGIRPEVTQDTWTLEITGAVAKPATLRWADLLALPAMEEARDVHCVTGWSLLDARFTGVSIRDVLALAAPTADARFAILRSADGYSTNLGLDDLYAPGVMLAHAFAGEPLIAAHGGPVRLLVSHLYLWKSAKWVTGIELLVEDSPGFWEERGYHRRGDPWAEQRYAHQDGSYYPRTERPMAAEFKADDEGLAALATMEAMEQGIRNGTVRAGPLGKPWWRRMLVNWISWPL